MEPRPTKADADKFSQSTQDLGEFGKLTPEEAAELLEAQSGVPTNWGSTADAIAALEARVARLRRDKEKLLDLLADEAAGHPDISRHVQSLNTELRAALDSLDHYRTQQKQTN